jgi:hypothetical protein
MISYSHCEQNRWYLYKVFDKTQEFLKAVLSSVERFGFR